MRLNGKGLAHAKQLVAQGRVNRDDPWSFDSDDRSALLGDPPDWDNYARWFLGIREDENPETRARFAYPFGKNGLLYRSAVIAIKQRAAQQQHITIAKAADMLMELIDGEKAARVRTVILTSDQPGFSQWVQLIPLGHVRTVDGREFIMNEEDAQHILERFRARVTDLPVTVEHVDLAGAVGWLRTLELRLPREDAEQLPEHGLWGLVEWTERGFGLVTKKAFRSMSPEILLSNDDPPHAVELLGASLVTNPALDGLALVATRLSQNETEKEKKMAENETLEKTVAELKAEVAALQHELDATKDENATLREQLEAEWCERKMTELKVSRIVTEELERLGREILKTGNRELYDMWAQTLPEKKYPTTARIGEPEKVTDEDVEFFETFEGEKALMSRAREIARKNNVPLSQALTQLAGKMWR